MATPPVLSVYAPTQQASSFTAQSYFESFGSSSPGENSIAFGPSGTGSIDFDFSAASLSAGGLRFVADNERMTLDEPMVVLSGATLPLFRLVSAVTVSANGLCKCQYWNGSSWIQLGTTFTPGSTQTIDMEWDLNGSTGYFRILQGGTVLAELTAANTLFTADTTMDTVAFSSSSSSISYRTYYSHVFVDDAIDGTRGLYWATDEASGTLGFYADFTGTPGNVGYYPGQTSSTAASQNTTAAGQKVTYPHTTIGAGLSDSGTVELVVVGGVMKALSDPGLHIKPLVRGASVDYTPAGSWQPAAAATRFYGVAMPNDPATGVAWASVAAVQAYEMGFESSATA